MRIIFHIDLDAFYATCAMIVEPYLRNKVFAIGKKGIGTDGVLSTSSYNARRKGIKAGMSLKEALDIYPQLTMIPPDYQLYSKYSKLFFKHLENYSNIILQGSIDEAYVDVTELAETIAPLTIAKNIQTSLEKEYGLTCSIGIAPTLFLAKMASDMQKPQGITILRKRDVQEKLYPLSIAELHGIGIKTYPRLQMYGVETIGDFVNQKNQSNILRVMTQRNYDVFLKRIFCLSTNVVQPDQYKIPQSISNETTFNYGRANYEIVMPFLNNLTKTVCRRMKESGMVSNTFGLKLRYENFETISRRIQIDEHTAEYSKVIDVIESLLEEYHNGNPLRLVGVFADPVVKKEALVEEYNLFTYQSISNKTS